MPFTYQKLHRCKQNKRSIAIHDTVHKMARDEARHSKAFEWLLARYFG